MIDHYDDILAYIFQFKAETEHSLTKVQRCAQLLHNPQDNYKIIHITGTNGKGSTSMMCFSLLKQRGKKVGIFTSPHLTDFRERFQTQDGYISQEDLIQIVNKIIDLNIDLSYFEKCTLIAFEYFKQQQCEYAVIEVGVWWLLDSTNIVYPLVSAITSIGYDHKELLGPTLEDIAFQKAGIIKPGIPIVINTPNTVIEHQAEEKWAPVLFAKQEKNTNLLWNHQKKNAAIAYEIGKYIGIPEDIINKGLQNVSHPWRLEYLLSNLLIDGAHNDQWLAALHLYLQSVQNNYTKIVYCFSLKKGKEAKVQSSIIEKFGREQEYVVVDYHHNLLTSAQEISQQLQPNRSSIATPDEIQQLAYHNKKILYVVFWSLYMIGGFYE